MSDKASNTKPLIFIFITVMIDTIGLGIIIPVLPQLITGLTDSKISVAAQYGGALAVVYAVTHFFFAPVLGNLSDAYGRRPVLLLSLFALGIDYVLMGYAPTIIWLFVGRFIAGAAGATFAVANAYIADTSAPEDRAKNFGLIGAAFGIGFVLGPALGGLLIEFGPRAPFFVAAALAFANMAYGYFILPETLAPENRRPFHLKRANPVGSIIQMNKYPLVLGLIIAALFYQIAHDANPSIWSYYTIEKLSWTPRDIGWSLAMVGISIAFVEGILIRFIIPRIGEKRAVYFGYVMAAIGFTGFALADTGTAMMLWIIPWSLMGIAGPALRAIIANQVPDDQQGELSGAMASMISLTAIISPVIMTQTFGFFASKASPVYFPGAPFILAAGMIIIAIIVVQHVTSRQPAT
jgi:DHA1 family tetracycline resistance protein-like MFS transporter